MYEFHVTVKNNNVEKFKKHCEKLKIKPIIIDTYVGEQVMTSSISKNINDIDNIVTSIKKYNYEILRIKVEKQPLDTIDTEHIYYESHIRLKLPLNFPEDVLKPLCLKYKLHKSRNIFKVDEKFKYRMLTYRDYGKDLLNFKNHIDIVKNNLNVMGILYDKIEVEECIFDSNINIDNKWIRKF